jgi:16S rRNA C967 or C1407 C5-methylase (RsmB/RsmF family)
MTFDEHYLGTLGACWPALRERLTQPVRQVARYTSWTGTAARPAGPELAISGCYEWTAEMMPTADDAGLFNFYRMDLASVLPAVVLDVQSGERVLDMCAAPGGKALILAEHLGAEGSLVVNDLSDARLGRLRRVLREYVPPEVLARIRLTHHDAARWGLFEPQTYDKILLDAPCSGERHLLQTPEELKKWSPARSRHLASRQYALLCAALDSLVISGKVVYSTCSLSPLENDAVIAKLLKKRAGQVQVSACETSTVAGLSGLAEPTEFGWQIWPDRDGWGPIYFCCLQRQ